MAVRFAVAAVVSLSVAFVALAFGDARAQSAGPQGTWLTQAGDAKVRIKSCGNALCGSIVWLRDPIDPNTGKPQVDDKNPDPARASRPRSSSSSHSRSAACSRAPAPRRAGSRRDRRPRPRPVRDGRGWSP